MRETEITFDAPPTDRDMGPNILVIDDELITRKQLRKICLTCAPETTPTFTECATLSEAYQALSLNQYHVVLLDKILESRNGLAEDGIAAIPELLRCQPHLQILVITNSSDPQDLEKALESGACGFVTKDRDPLIKAQVRKAIENAYLKITVTRQQKTAPTPRDKFVAVSPLSRRLAETLVSASQVASPVLLLGEPGVGKGACARRLHELRKRYLKQKDRPFFNINVAAIPETLVERELFGSEPGAFTDAKELKQGYFELVHNGDIFLDEIGDLSLAMQAKLLKVLEKHAFFRLGGSKEIRSSFRLIAATNRDLEEMIKEGTFREDLYLRISTIPVPVPGLSERKQDIPELLRTLLAKYCQENTLSLRYEDLPRDYIAYLQEEPPRGNIRGLEHSLCRLLTFAPRDENGTPDLSHWAGYAKHQVRAKRGEVAPKNVITLDLLYHGTYAVMEPGFPGLDAVLKQVEKQIVLEARGKYHTAKEGAAALDIANSSMSIKLQRYVQPG